jgi:hypothetical protein
MILTVQRKRKFLITMLVIIGCATMINYGLYNTLNTYFNTNEELYDSVQWNIISVVIILAIVTVIMIVLIPSENIKEVMAKMENNSGGPVLEGTGGTTASGTELTPEQTLQNMIDEELEDSKK